LTLSACARTRTNCPCRACSHRPITSAASNSTGTCVTVGGLKLVREIEDHGDRRIRPRIRLHEQRNLLTEPRRNAAHILHPSAFEPIL
jgi:hypothetical protein